MKEQLLDKITLFINFLKQIEAIEENPYSAGIDVKKLLMDEEAYSDDILELIKQLPDDTEEKKEA